jgi:hypothetical protein
MIVYNGCHMALCCGQAWPREVYVNPEVRQHSKHMENGTMTQCTAAGTAHTAASGLQMTATRQG